MNCYGDMWLTAWNVERNFILRRNDELILADDN